MKKYYIIESTKPNKNGHVSHIMVERSDGCLYELSPKTGKMLSKQNYLKLDDYINVWGYKLVDVKNATFTGALYFPFIDYLKDNNLI
jgi:hypothetical protein